MTKSKYKVPPIVTHEQLLNILSYDPITGEFQRDGKIYGPNCKGGYVQIRIFNKLYYGHTLAWFYMTGEWPKQDVEHRDLNRGNNRWHNLREGSRGDNMANTRIRADNTSGIKGVCWAVREQKWVAKIQKDNRSIFLGYFNSKEEAARAYIKAADELFGEFSRHDEADDLLGNVIPFGRIA